MANKHFNGFDGLVGLFCQRLHKTLTSLFDHQNVAPLKSWKIAI